MGNLARRLAALSSAKAIRSITLPFGEWPPDLPDYGNPGVLAASGVIPDLRGYRPFKGLNAQSNALDSTALGAFSATDASNNVYVYAGDAGKLYELVDLTFTDESKGGGYTVAADDIWEFALFKSTVLATNFTDPVQSIAIGGGAAGAFADHITSTLTPKAKHVGTVGQFLVLGNTTDAVDGHVPNRLWWSGFGDSTDFDPDATTQSDYEDFAEGGWVQRIIGGAEYGVIFQEQRIRRMQYIGPPAVFAVPSVDRSRGTPIPNSVIGHGRNVFYISEEGFFRFDGSQSVPIGNQKVDRTFWGQFDIANKALVSAAIDPLNKLVAWAFPAGTSAVNRIYLYNWGVDRWAEVPITMQILLRTQTQGYTLDSLDTLGTDIDDTAVFSESFDSDAYKGGKVRFAAMDDDNKLAYFTGGNLEAIIGTTEAQPIPGRRSIITKARPLIDGTDSSDTVVSFLKRRRQQDTRSLTSATPSVLNADGAVTQTSEGRYHSLRITVPANKDWTYAQGIEVDVVDAGDT